MNRLNGITLVIQADIWGVSQSLERIRIAIKVEGNTPRLKSIFLHSPHHEEITKGFNDNQKIKDLYFKLGVIDGGNGGAVDFIDENDDAVLAFDFCEYEWSILDIYQDIDVVDKLIDKSTKQYGDITVSDNKIPQETKELIQEVFNKAFEKDVYS